MSNEHIIIEGGGANGLFALGALKWLFERGVEPKTIMGASIGGNIALGLASLRQHNLKWTEANNQLIEKFNLISWSDFIGPFDWKFWVKGGLFHNNMAKIFRSILDDHKLPNIKTKVAVALCDIDAPEGIRIEGNILGIPKNYMISDLAAMTANIPGLFSHLKDPFNGHRIYDGGVGCNDMVSYIVDVAESSKIDEATIYVIRLASWQPSKSVIYGPLNNLLELFALSRRRCEDLSIKISKLYQKLKPKFKVIIYDFPEDIGTLSFKAGENKKWVEEAYNRMS